MESKVSTADHAPLPPSASTATTQSVSSLVQKTNELEKRMDRNEFQTQVLLHWADTMFKDHKSLQKQVDYNASRTHENELILGGMVEIEDQSPFQEVTAFIKQKLDIEAT